MQAERETAKGGGGVPVASIQQLIEYAVKEIIAGDREAARGLILQIDIERLARERKERIRSIWSRGLRRGSFASERRARSSGVSEPTKRRIFERDSWTCRFCGERTVDPLVLRAVSAALPDVFPYHLNWKLEECHLLYWTHTSSLEHLVPLARGGDDGEVNYVTTCYGCNDARGDHTIEELGWALRPISADGWRGLTEYLPGLERVLGGSIPKRSSVPSGTARARGPSGGRFAPAATIEVGWLIRVAMAGRTQRRPHRVEAINGRVLSLREMWRSNGRWVESPNLHCVRLEGNVEVLTPFAPRQGELA